VVGVEDMDEGDIFLRIGREREPGPGGAGRVHQGGRQGGCGLFAVRCRVTHGIVLLFALRF
jgi:hypothetical protein